MPAWLLCALLLADAQDEPLVVSGPIKDVTYLADGTSLLSIEYDGAMRTWTREKGTWRFSKESLKVTVTAVGHAADLSWTAIGTSEGTLKLVRPTPLEVKRERKVADAAITFVGFSLDGVRVLVGDSKGRLRVLAADDLSEVSCFVAGGEGITGAAAVDEGPLVVSNRDGTVATFKERRSISAWKLAEQLTHMHPLPHSRSIIMAGSTAGDIRVIDAETGGTIHTWKAHSARVSCITSSRCGSLVATAGEDLTVCIWERGTWNLVARFKGGSPSSVSFDRTHNRIVSGNADATIRFFDIHNAIRQAVPDTEPRIRELLGADDAARGVGLAVSLSAEALLRARESEGPTSDEVRARIAHLESGDPAVRDAADLWLASSFLYAEDMLQTALKAQASQDVKNRLAAIVRDVPRRTLLRGESLRRARIIGALASKNTEESRKALKSIAETATSVTERSWARAALTD